MKWGTLSVIDWLQGMQRDWASPCYGLMPLRDTRHLISPKCTGHGTEKSKWVLVPKTIPAEFGTTDDESFHAWQRREPTSKASGWAADKRSSS